MGQKLGKAPRSLAGAIVALLVCLVFGGGWIAVTAFADAKALAPAVPQLWTLRWSATHGVIVRSAVDNTSDPPEADVEYTYSAGGVERAGDVVRHITWTDFNGQQLAQVYADRFPAGAAVTVYYDPKDPDRSVLVRGIEGIDLFFLLFLTPFNLTAVAAAVVIMVLLIATVRTVLFGKKEESQGQETGEDLEEGLGVFRLPGRVRVRAPSISPLGAAVLAAVFGPIPLVIGVGFASGGTPPSTDLMQIIWTAYPGSVLLLYVALAARVSSGARDLVIDHEEGTVTLPAQCGRRKREQFPITAAQRAHVIIEHVKREDGGTNYYPTLTLDGAGPMRLAKWESEERAKKLARFLRKELALPLQPSEDPEDTEVPGDAPWEETFPEEGPGAGA